MTICYFGIYNSEYSRNRILIKGLRVNGIKVIECSTRKKGIGKYFYLIKKHWELRNDYDIMIVGFPGYQTMILARFLTKKKIIFDSFTSIYDSMVNDRKCVLSGSVKAKYFWFLDWASCQLADKILLDTNENINYYIKTFNINKKKFLRIFVGSDNQFFFPKKRKKITKIF